MEEFTKAIKLAKKSIAKRDNHHVNINRIIKSYENIR